VLQDGALHLDKSALAVWMHDLEHEFAAIFCTQMKIVVVFARKRMRGSFYRKKPPRNFLCF